MEDKIGTAGVSGSGPLASVVIPTFNGGPRLRECLNAVRGQELAGGLEVVIIDSESTDGTAELARDYADVFIQTRKKDFNHGLTRNAAIEKARGEFVALLVQDAVPVGSSWLSAMIENFNDAKVAGCYSRQVPRSDCPPLLKARLERWSASRAERVEKSLDVEDDMSQIPGRDLVDLISFDNVSSCLRRSVWEALPFPRRAFGEDLWWARSVLLAGYRIVFEPRSVVVHSHSNSMWYEFKRVYLDHQNWNDLIGLRLFHRLREVFGASASGFGEALDDLGRQGLNGPGRLFWSAYALPYVASQNLAQYLGGNSRRLEKRWSWFARVDRFLGRGV